MEQAMDFSKQYGELAARLGDIEYKLSLLNVQKEMLIETIKQLDALAGKVRASETQESSSKGNEPRDPSSN